MILYFDTSALVKKYVKEQGTKEVVALFRKAEAIAISKVGYAEILAAFYRKHREDHITSKLLRKMVDSFKNDWNSFISVNITTVLNNKVEDFVSRYGLRGFDAIHLGAASILRDQLQEELLFVCADKKLFSAATSDGFRTLLPE